MILNGSTTIFIDIHSGLLGQAIRIAIRIENPGQIHCVAAIRIAIRDFLYDSNHDLRVIRDLRFTIRHSIRFVIHDDSMRFAIHDSRFDPICSSWFTFRFNCDSPGFVYFRVSRGHTDWLDYLWAVQGVLEMVLSYMASSCFNTSSYGAILLNFNRNLQFAVLYWQEKGIETW